MNGTYLSKLKIGAAPVVLGAALIATPAMAQGEQGAESASDGVIVVTGSRIARPDIEAPVPVAVLSSADLQADGAQNISDIINDMPQVGIGSTRTNSNFLTSGTGIATVDLRGLGASRTLVLVNGRRFVGGLSGDSAVDLNNIPTDFIERVEVVTGGSSAVYGSDAIAGVVNFILKDNFEGVSVRGQTSISDEGDSPRYMASITAGTRFGADDRGSVMLNYTYDKDGGLLSRDRSISAQDCAFLICGPASYSAFSPQGQFILTNGTTLDNANGVYTFDRGNNLVTGYPTGSGFNRNGVRRIATPLTRHLVSGTAKYELADNLELYGEATYAKVKSRASLEASALGFGAVPNPDAPGYSIDNPFIPPSLAAIIADRNSDGDLTNDVTSISMRRRFNEVFDRSNIASRDTWRAVAGIRGEIAPKWSFDVNYVYGRVRDSNSSEDVDINRLTNALDAVLLNGEIVCRSAAARAEGCAPINLFGFGTASPEASAYVQAVVPKSQVITNTQHVLNASVTGSLFDLGAGDVGIAIGAEYRKEKTVDDLDILTNTGGNSGNQIPDMVGSWNTKEIFAEVNVPLIRDGFVPYFGLIGAVRYSDYSTIGSVFSWNAGAELEVFNGLKLRGVYARANRAPNSGELFSQPSETFAAIDDPCNGVTLTASNEYAAACRAIPAIAAALQSGDFEYTLADLQGINGFVGGNLALQEETAKTFTIGAVISPAQLRNFSLTVDYYNIVLDGAINTIGRNYAVQQCLLTGEALYCDNVTRDASTGRITRVDGQLINVARLKNSGIDVGVRYATPLGLAGDDRLSLNANYTYLIEQSFQADPSADVEDYAGTFGQAYSRHRLNARVAYNVDKFTVSWQTKFLSGGKFDKDFVNANPDVVALNKIDDYWLHDLQLRFDATKKHSFFIGVDNVFDTKPPYLPGTPFGTPTGLETSEAFDLFGRMFTAGATIRF